MKMERYADILSRILAHAQTDPELQTVIALGSSVRGDVPADAYSDLDLLIVTSGPEKWFSGEYPSRFGEIRISFLEPTLGGGKERRSIYGEDRDVDMIILTPAQFEKAVDDGTAGWVMNRGYSVLYDACGAAPRLEKGIRPVVHPPEMGEEAFRNLVNDFYFHILWTSKKCLRGELWAAKMCLDAYLKTKLLSMIEFYCSRVSGKDVWHDGRFLDTWADAFILDGLREAFAVYDLGSIPAALFATCRLFARLAGEAAEKEGLDYPREAEACALSYLKTHFPEAGNP